ASDVSWLRVLPRGKINGAGQGGDHEAGGCRALAHARAVRSRKTCLGGLRSMSSGREKPGDGGHYFADKGNLRHLPQSARRRGEFLRYLSRIPQAATPTCGGMIRWGTD